MDGYSHVGESNAARSLRLTDGAYKSELDAYEQYDMRLMRFLPEHVCMMTFMMSRKLKYDISHRQVR